LQLFNLLKKPLLAGGGETRSVSPPFGPVRADQIVAKLTVTRPKVSKEPSQIFIDQRSGLPVYEGEGTTDGGFAVVYGDAVKEALS
jgi:hypothetical protein